MAEAFTEADLRDWLDRNINDLVWSIENLDSMEAALSARLTDFQSKRFDDDFQLLQECLAAVLAKRFADSIEALKSCGSLTSLGTEREMFFSTLPGRNPSADILAVGDEAGAFVLLEVKIDHNTAREAVTEVSAYSNGLAGRFWGLSSFDSIWVVVSTVYRPTLSAALVYQQLLAGRCVVPLRASVDTLNGSISGVRLTLEDLVTHASYPASITDALFSSSVYELHAADFSNNPSDVVLHFISSEYVARGAIGFCFRRLPTFS